MIEDVPPLILSRLLFPERGSVWFNSGALHSHVIALLPLVYRSQTLLCW